MYLDKAVMQWRRQRWSAQTKRLALHRKAAAAMLAAEDYARRVESGDITEASKTSSAEEQDQSNTNVMCCMCFSGEHEVSERARRKLSCRNCGMKYHRSCMKSRAQHSSTKLYCPIIFEILFFWSSWTCPCCRTCEVCRSTADQHRLMFCKRCDGVPK